MLARNTGLETGISAGWKPGNGPAVIEELSSTALLHPSDSAYVDEFGNLIVNLGLEHPHD